MSSYAGLDEIGLRKLLDTSSDITERRKIRAALRELRTNNNNSVVHPHIRTPISPSKLSHHQSFRSERRRRPEIDDSTKKSQDDDILYRSRRRREIDAGKGGGGGGEGDDGDDENEAVVDIEMKIKDIGSDEHKLTKLLSETRDFNDRRKVRSAIREVKKKTRQQDDSDTPTKPTNQSEARPPAEAVVSVLQENQTNLALSRSTQGQRSSLEGQGVSQDSQTTGGRDVEQEIVALQKQLENTETYEERRKLRAEIRELRQKKTASPLPRTSNSPSYNNNSSNTNSNNSRGLATTHEFESSIKPDGAIILKNHGVREEEEKSSGRTSEIRKAEAEPKGTPFLVDDLVKEREEDKEKLSRGETSEGGTDKPSSSSASSSSPSTSLASSREATKVDDERIAGTPEERVSVSHGNQDVEDVSGQSEVVQEVEASVLPVSSSISSSTSSSSSLSPSPPLPSSLTSSLLLSKPSILPEPEVETDSVERDSVVSQESSCHSDIKSETDVERGDTPKVEEAGPESSSEPVLEIREDVEMDADDEASKCDSVQTKPSPLVRKVRPEAAASSSSSSPSSSSSSSSSSGTSSSGSSSELDEVKGQTKEKRRAKGLKEAMRRRAQLKASQLASESAKEVKQEKKVESQETSSQEESSPVSKAVKDETKLEKVATVLEGDNKNKNNANVTSRTVENLVVESKLEVKNVEDASEVPKKEGEESSMKVEQKERDEDATDSASSVSQTSSSSSSSSSIEGNGMEIIDVHKNVSSSQELDTVSKAKDSPATVSSKITMSLHSPVTSTTTFPISSSTSPSTSTSENMSSVIEVIPRMSEKIQSSQSVSNSASSQSQKASSPIGEDTQDGAVLSVNKTDSNDHSTDKPLKSISSPGTSSTPSIPRNFGHPFRFGKVRDDNAIPSPKKITTSVRRSESAVSSLQSKRNKFLNRPRPDDDTSPTSSSPARSFKNVVSGSKFAALREKFSASNDNSNNNAGQGKYGGYSPTSPSTPKSPWQQKSPSPSSLYGGSITEESSLNSSSEQKKSIYGTPPSTPPTPLPYKTPPESPLDFRSKTASPSTPLASSTPTGSAELKSPTAAELKRQFLFGTDDSQQGDVFDVESGSKDENSNLKDISMAPIEQIEDEAALEKMLEEATEFDERKKIRSRLREVRKKKRDEREQKALAQERAFEEKMHKLEVESAQQRMRAVGLNVQTPGDRTKTVTETKDDGKTKTVVETTMRDSGSSKSVQMTIMSKTEDEGFKSQSLQQESKSISIGPGGSSSVTMSKTVSSSSSSSSTTTDKPKGRPKTKFEEDMETKKREREDKRKQDEARFKEQQMQRKKEAYELKKKQAEEAKNRKAALFNKFGGAGGGAKPAGGGGTTMKVQNATTIKQKLLEWAQRVTRGYAGVNVTNFSSSWADGLAFCAVIHHYYPDSFDFNTLDPKQRRKNFDLAFNTAEQQADIMPLLDTDDMIMMKNNPDWKCVFTYVQSLYRHLNK